MHESPSTPSDAALMAEVAMLTQRGGLPVSAADLTILFDAYRGSRAQLAALRAVLDPSEEPDFVFSPTRGTAASR
jgi:hypothetical protein